MHKYFGPASDRIISIPIRGGHYINVEGIPYNLTQKEADKICKVLLAFSLAPEDQ